MCIRDSHKDGVPPAYFCHAIRAAGGGGGAFLGRVGHRQISFPFSSFLRRSIFSRALAFLKFSPVMRTGVHISCLLYTSWYARRTKKIDYFITAGDTPAEIEKQYSDATGRTPLMPEFGLGYWQCKLRYRNQEELLKVAREQDVYKRQC